MLEFTKNIFAKNKHNIVFDKYDLTTEVYIIEKNHKITEGTMYGICGFSMLLYTGLSFLLPWQNANNLIIPVGLFLVGGLVYMLGCITGFIINDLCQPLLDKLAVFKKVNHTKSSIKEKLLALCETEHFQFSLLSYLQKISDSLDTFTFEERKYDKKRYSAMSGINGLVYNLKRHFSEKDYEKAVNYLMEYESIEKIQKALIIEKKLILEGKNRYDQDREASIRAKNLDSYEDAFNNFMEKPKSANNSKLEVELENEVELKKYF